MFNRVKEIRVWLIRIFGGSKPDVRAVGKSLRFGDKRLCDPIHCHVNLTAGPAASKIIGG
jgi:hypothetical protein